MHPQKSIAVKGPGNTIRRTEAGRRPSSRSALLTGVTLAVVGVTLSAGVSAQNAGTTLDPEKPIRQYVHDVWTLEDGLPSGTILDITQTQDGYLWLATSRGLARFDGVQFKTFDTANTPALMSNTLVALLESDDGSLWIASRGGGLTRYRQGKFTTYTTSEGLASNNVERLAGDDAGTLWIVTAGTLQWLRDGDITTVPIPDSIAPTRVSDVAIGPDGSAWFTSERWLYRHRQDEVERFGPAHGLPEQLDRVWVDRAGNLWIGLLPSGLIRFTNEQVFVYDLESVYGLPRAAYQISALLEDRAGSLWLGGGGLRRVGDPELFLQSDGLSDGRVRSLYEDRQGNLWVGTYNGLNRLKNGAITSYTSTDGLGPLTRAVIQDAGGRLWVASTFGLAYRANRVWLRSPDSQDFTTAGHLATDSSGALWVGTDNGLFRKSMNGVRRYTTGDGLAANWIYGLEATRGGSVHVVTWSGTSVQLHQFTEGGFTTVGRPLSLNIGAGIFDHGVLLEDSHGMFWLSGTDGLYHLREGDGEWTAVVEADGMVVMEAYEDDEGVLWFGTDGTGLLRIEEGDVTVFGSRDGLFDDTVWAILGDDRRNLWMTSDRGIFTVNRDDAMAYQAGEISRLPSRSYGRSAGMKNLEGSGLGKPSGWQLQDGTLAFATVDGVAVVDPRLAVGSATPHPVLIEEVLANTEPVELSDGGRLAADKRELEFRYTAPNFRDADNVQFRYRLSDFDDDWVYAGTRRLAHYTNVPPGRYQFRVMASTEPGVWDETEASLTFSVAPFFYETWWFRAAAVLVVTMLLRHGYRVRTRSIRARSDALQREVNEKNAAVSGLRQSEERFRRVVVNAPDAFLLVGLDGKIAFANQRATDVFGYDPGELLGAHVEILIPPRFAARQVEHFDNYLNDPVTRQVGEVEGQGEEEPLYALRKDGHERRVVINLTPLESEEGIQIACDIRDVTDSLRAKEESDRQARELARASRVTTMGVLAASIAHELSQPLTAIVSNAQAGRRFLDRQVADPDEVRAALTDIADHGKRAGAIIQRLRDLLRHGEHPQTCLALNTIVREILPLVSGETILKHIEVVLDLDPGLPEVQGDRVQIQQVLLNLIVNACEAMADEFNDPRQLTVRTSNGAGDMIEVAVQDTGRGASPEQIEQIFEPFYTTKDDGMGMGLSICRTIIERHRGRLWATSNPEGGTTFRFVLPVSGSNQKA